ncbi:MAG TPA: hypothetical protein VJ891_17750 [Casimicrobiaceae bacterium]|nr:hypothetical protein [Casimicrobiaceae bacterium]
MNASTIGVIGLSALLLTACETVNGPQAVANAEAQKEGCPAGVTVVTSTPEQMRLANRPGSVQTDQMKEAEGKLALTGVKQNEPRELQQKVAPEESLTSKSIRGC